MKFYQCRTKDKNHAREFSQSKLPMPWCHRFGRVGWCLWGSQKMRWSPSLVGCKCLWSIIPRVTIPIMTFFQMDVWLSYQCLYFSVGYTGDSTWFEQRQKPPSKKVTGGETKLGPRKWNPRLRKRAEALAEADADRPIAEGPRKTISWRACFRGSSTEAESTYQSSAEAETVVAEDK